MQEATDLEAQDRLVSRRDVANRWASSTETVKRSEKEGLLHPVHFNKRLLRYSLAEVIAVERAGRNGALPQKGLSAAEIARNKKLARGHKTFVARKTRKTPRVSETPTTPKIGFH